MLRRETYVFRASFRIENQRILTGYIHDSLEKAAPMNSIGVLFPPYAFFSSGWTVVQYDTSNFPHFQQSNIP